jgi:polyribonucleotide nucleotidyltransferase
MDQETVVIATLAACSIGSLVLGAYCTRSKADDDDDTHGQNTNVTTNVRKNPVKNNKNVKKKKPKTPRPKVKAPAKNVTKNNINSNEEKNSKNSSKSSKKKDEKKKKKNAAKEEKNAVAKAEDTNFDEGEWETIAPQAKSPKRKKKKSTEDNSMSPEKNIKKKVERETVFIPIDAANIGRLVGKAGANVKRIEKETGARISVNSDGPETPQILVKGFAKQIEAAKVQIEASINKTDGNQKREPATYEATEKLVLKSPQNRSSLIGPKGATIRKLEANSGAIFAVDRDTNSVTISGKKAAVAKGVRMVKNLLANLNYERVIEINRDDVGAVLGKKGSRIQGIEKTAKARLKVIRNEEVCKVAITGPKDNVLHAEKLLKEALKNASNPTFELKEGEIVEERELGSAVSTVIGQKGKNIHKIKDESKTRIEIAKKATKCFIIGTPENVKKAQELIDETVTRFEKFLEKQRNNEDKIDRNLDEVEDGEIVEDYPIKPNTSGNWGDMED